MQEEYDDIKLKVTHINWQFEASKDERLHSQVYVQLKKLMSMKAIKELFNDHSMFIKANKTISLLARLYCGKPSDRCKKHEGCKCNYDLSKICDLCDKTCERKPARWEREYETTLEGNKMLMERAYSLEVFKHNAKKHIIKIFFA
ncbi:45049_t:CDS:2 [Gigaspora margarita]|uniref:45049_t:CDS:1 n=1 Tax=Gigaspora margarita TaxID=4874 RepID=A0ABN7UDL6_GIGMA|nr:45049_t:CDS:2 [Gigaspora margarita]